MKQIRVIQSLVININTLKKQLKSIQFLLLTISAGFCNVATAQTNPSPTQGVKAVSAVYEIIDITLCARRNTRPTYTFAPNLTIPKGPTELNWQSVKDNFQVPAWLQDGKFGIFIHWGEHTVPAYHNERYAKRMYNGFYYFFSNFDTKMIEV
ncbi:MAG TPA: alpha-L-fucosidase [Prolixibacteraceae bacterium]|nr:alpha-L-fucosidase [Prolixibacteraceae bacterium]